VEAEDGEGEPLERAARRAVVGLHVEYAERGNKHGIIFIFSLFCENLHLEYVRIHVNYRVNQAEYVVHILAVAPQEYVNIYSTRRVVGLRGRKRNRSHTQTHQKNNTTHDTTRTAP